MELFSKFGLEAKFSFNQTNPSENILPTKDEVLQTLKNWVQVNSKLSDSELKQLALKMQNASEGDLLKWAKDWGISFQESKINTTDPSDQTSFGPDRQDELAIAIVQAPLPDPQNELPSKENLNFLRAVLPRIFNTPTTPAEIRKQWQQTLSNLWNALSSTTSATPTQSETSKSKFASTPDRDKQIQQWIKPFLESELIKDKILLIQSPLPQSQAHSPLPWGAHLVQVRQNLDPIIHEEQQSQTSDSEATPESPSTLGEANPKDKSQIPIDPAKTSSTVNPNSRIQTQFDLIFASGQTHRISLENIKEITPSLVRTLLLDHSSKSMETHPLRDAQQLALNNSGNIPSTDKVNPLISESRSGPVSNTAFTSKNDTEQTDSNGNLFVNKTLLNFAKDGTYKPILAKTNTSETVESTGSTLPKLAYFITKNDQQILIPIPEVEDDEIAGFLQHKQFLPTPQIIEDLQSLQNWTLPLPASTPRSDNKLVDALLQSFGLLRTQNLGQPLEQLRDISTALALTNANDTFNPKEIVSQTHLFKQVTDLEKPIRELLSSTPNPTPLESNLSQNWPKEKPLLNTHEFKTLISNFATQIEKQFQGKSEHSTHDVQVLQQSHKLLRQMDLEQTLAPAPDNQQSLYFLQNGQLNRAQVSWQKDSEASKHKAGFAPSYSIQTSAPYLGQIQIRYQAENDQADIYIREGKGYRQAYEDEKDLLQNELQQIQVELRKLSIINTSPVPAKKQIQDLSQGVDLKA